MSDTTYTAPLSANPYPVYVRAIDCKYETHVLFALDKVVSLESCGEYSTIVSLSSGKELEVLVAFHVLVDLLADRGNTEVSLLPPGTSVVESVKPESESES